MSILYEELKKKAADETKKDEMIFTGRMQYYNMPINYFGMTYSDLLSMVDTCIELFKDPKLTTQPIAGRRKYIAVDNSLNSIIAIIALLECGATPVIIDGKNLPAINEFRLPYLEYGDNPEGNEVENFWMDFYLKKLNSDKELPGEDKPGGKLIICSSGSEGASPHLNLVSEEDLVKLPNQYGDDDSTFLSYISCANISGILTNLVNPLIHNTKVLLSQNFDLETIYFADEYNKFLAKNFNRKYVEKRYFCSTANPNLMQLLFQKEDYFDGDLYDTIHIEGDELVVPEKREEYQLISFNDKYQAKIESGNLPHADSMMFPRNIISYLEKADLEGIDLSSMRHIYLSGGINSEDVVKKVREKIPSIPEGVFTNLYGSTEANGVICTCDEKDFKTCYISVGDYESGKISYTFDKKKFYEISNGETKEIPAPKDLFEYMPYLTVSSKKEDSVTVDDKLKIHYNGMPTGDLGIYIDNQLYVLGRGSDLIKLNGRSYIIHSLESYYSNEIGSKVYIRPIDEEGVHLFIKESPLKMTPELVLKFKKALDISLNTECFHINPPIFIDDHIFPESKISGKISKPYLLLYNEYAKDQFENFRNFPYSITTKAKRVAEQFATYSPRVLENGCFLIDMSRRVILPLNDILESFYTPTHTNHEDVILYVPKPEIIFMTEEHMLFSNKSIYTDLNTGLMGTIMEEAMRLKNEGIDVMKMKKPLDKNLTGEELVKQLKYNIIVDVIRRYKEKRLYEMYLNSLTPEERERYEKGLPIRDKNKDEEDKEKQDGTPKEDEKVKSLNNKNNNNSKK